MQLARFFLGQFRVDFSQAPIHRVELAFDRFPAPGGALPVDVPGFQAEDGPQDLLAAGGRLLGELVGPALQEERNVDERIVVQAHDMLDARLRIPQGPFGQGTPGQLLINDRGFQAAALGDLELQCGGFTARQAADDSVDAVLVGEGEGHFRHFGLQVDHGLVAFAGLAEQHPGDRIQQGRLTGPVRAGDACQVEAAEIHFDRRIIRKETGEL